MASEPDDDRFRSRKWRLSLASFAFGAVMLVALLAFNAADDGPMNWGAAAGHLEWWKWVNATILGIYGGANVLDKKLGGGQ